jgi:hypothetical protein
MNEQDDWDPDYEIDVFAEHTLNNIKNVSELSHIITNTV